MNPIAGSLGNESEDVVPASMAEFLKDASEPALGIGLLRLDDFLHII